MGSKTEEQPVTSDVEKAAIPAAKDDAEEDEYPPFAKVIIIMTAVYLAMFLVALVSFPVVKFSMLADHRRIEQFSEPPSQRLRMTSIRSTMLAGMQAPTSLRSVRFNSSTADCIHFIPANGSFSAPLCYLKLEYAHLQL
jgi:hypothetical protein